jgi:hypothetical protein
MLQKVKTEFFIFSPENKEIINNKVVFRYGVVLRWGSTRNLAKHTKPRNHSKSFSRRVFYAIAFYVLFRDSKQKDLIVEKPDACYS